MDQLLPAGKSYAKASLTIEEATEWFKTSLRHGFPLTEVAQAPRLMDHVVEALDESPDAGAQPFRAALAPVDGSV